jgi:hypothetical protein
MGISTRSSQLVFWAILLLGFSLVVARGAIRMTRGKFVKMGRAIRVVFREFRSHAIIQAFVEAPSTLQPIG